MDINRKAKLLMARIRFLKEEYQIIEEVNIEATEKFKTAALDDPEIFSKISSLSKKKVSDNFVTNITPPPRSKKKYSPQEKSIYKKIALKTHPDRLLNLSKEEKEKKKALFESARHAIVSEDYYTLFEVAKELKFPLKNFEEKHIENFKNSIIDLEGKIKNIKNSYVWVWFFSEKDQKNRVLGEYKKSLG